METIDETNMDDLDVVDNVEDNEEAVATANAMSGDEVNEFLSPNSPEADTVPGSLTSQWSLLSSG